MDKSKYIGKYVIAGGDLKSVLKTNVVTTYRKRSQDLRNQSRMTQPNWKDLRKSWQIWI